ncbi:MAG: class I SAM-dependent methyltransferase [Candidatus Eremiobacteraeota bacterium]|nr:class I SAM-dependent methyltransferase [Candidatus Eremiobacteraeota bacterium]MCW5872010.1 class I SAM-dependent methyltransferase [Candidatus Eremiobacteraeota bacterium]
MGQAILELADQLRQQHFNESTVRRLLGVPDLVRQPYFPVEETCEAARWINFWFRHQPQSRQGAWVDALLELGLLQRQGSLVRALCTLTPCADVFLLAEADLQPDSRLYALARLAPPGPALHLHCGAGLLPLLRGGTCHDPNPRALAFSELNARLNGRPFQPSQAAAPQVTVCLPFPIPARGQLPQNPDLRPYLEKVEPGGSLTVACSLVAPLELENHAFEQFDYARASAAEYAACLADLPRLVAAFGPENGRQAYAGEVTRRLDELEAAGIDHIYDSILVIHKASGSRRRQSIAYPLPEPIVRQRWAEEPLPQQHPYNEAALRELLDLPEVLFTPDQIPGLLHRLRHNRSPLANQARYWLLQPKKAMLFPCLGQLFFTDPMFGEKTDQVYWLGPDSLALARCVPRQPCGRSLDLCTGSGVQAVLNARHSQESWAVDINPRAVHFARLNARFNRQKITVKTGNLYQPVDGSFDLITANPPFVPTPEAGLQLFRPGGASGEEITAEIIRQLPTRLNENGLLALVSQCPIIEGSDALERVHGWLGHAPGWGLLQLRFGALSRAGLIASHTHDHQKWEASYRRLKIQGAHLAVTLVKRLPPGQPEFRRILDLEMPRASISAAVALACLA